MENDLYSRGYDMLQKGMPLDEIAEALGFHDVYSLLAGTCLRDLNLPTRIENVVENVVYYDADADETAFGYRIGTWLRDRPGYVSARRSLGC